MAAPYTGTWRQSVLASAKYSGALKQGTGINPIHAVRSPNPAFQDYGVKLGYDTPDLGTGDGTEAYIDTQNWPPPLDIDQDPTLQRAIQNELIDHPVWDHRDQVPANQRYNNPAWPSWGGSRKSEPGGNFIRSMLRGALATITMRQTPNETVTEGWVNKAHGIVGDSIDSDPSQLVMNTSEVQRYKVRTGSQSPGRASEYNAPIQSRVVGQKLKVYSGNERHWDMTPYDQDDIIRPFLSRQAGTGYTQWQLPNEMYQSSAMQREPASDPYQGDVTPTENIGGDYSYEDGQYYYA
jgi:hypothetical protein